MKNWKKHISFILIFMMMMEISLPHTVYAENLNQAKTETTVDENENSVNTVDSDINDSEIDNAETDDSGIEDTPIVDGKNSDSDTPDSNEESDNPNGIAETEDTQDLSISDTAWELLTNYADVFNDRIEVKSSDAFTILSNCDASRYADKNILLSSSLTTGYITIPASVEVNNVTYSFKGLGDETNPYSGRFDVSRNDTNKMTISIPSPLFNYISSTASFNEKSVVLMIGGEKQPSTSFGGNAYFASNYIFADSTEYTLNVQISFEPNDKARIINRPLIDKAKGNGGTLKITMDYTNLGKPEIATGTAEDEVNAGLICNTLEKGTLDTSGVTFPSEWNVTSAGASAGGIVGLMKANTKLVLPAWGDNDTVTVTGNRNAGGVVGTCGNDAEISFEGTLKLTATATATTGNAGGFVGEAQDIKLLTDKGIHITGGTMTAGQNAGGLFGVYRFEKDTSWRTFDNKYTIGAVSVIGTNAGGVFGFLHNKSTGSAFQLDGGSKETPLSTEIVSLDALNAGGLIGQYGQANLKASLKIANVTAKSQLAADRGDNNYGGLIGRFSSKDVGYGYVHTDNVTTEMNRNGKAVYGSFGGVVADAQDGYFLDVANFTLNCIDDGMGGNIYGGVVGRIPSGVLRLSGTTDLSKAKVTNTGDNYTNSMGQIVGYRNNALVYATGSGNDDNSGWKLIRCDNVRASDIGSYGEVLRNGSNLTMEGEDGLLTVVDNEHTVIVGAATTEINTTLDFAKIALAVQLNKGTGLEGALRVTSGEEIYNAELKLKADINLTGTGLIGLWRDNGKANDNEDTHGFQGTFNGNNNTIKVATGESYGMRDGQPATGEGSGQLYKHGYLGIFAVADGATINEVKIDGTMTFGADDAGCAGTLVGKSIGEELTIKGCEVKDSFTLSYNRNNQSDVDTDKEFYVGGLVGRIDAKVSTDGTTDTNNGAYTFTGNTISGTISAENVGKHARMGGMIGLINRKSKDVAPTNFVLNLTDTTIKGLQMTSDATTSTGGLLGYDWQNTAVTFRNVQVDQNTVNDEPRITKIESKGTANFGGLVYKATGYWDVKKNNGDKPGISLSNATFSGKATANTDGLLVFQATEDYTSALYLEIGADAYKIEANVTVKEATLTKFDELVGKSIRDSNKTGNGQAVISIATEKVSGKLNTYKNVTKKNGSADWAVNPDSRYYYNLDTYRLDETGNVALKEGSNTIANSAQLLCWSVSKYAANNIKSYFNKNNSESTWALKEDGNYDLREYSYYPVSLGATENLTLNGNNATIKFYNDEIETDIKGTESNPLKSTRTNSQHYLMHFGLFRDFTSGDDITEKEIYTCSVNNLKLQGNVGGCKNVSGALFCGTVSGSKKNDTIRTHKVDVSGVTLDNLSVVGISEKDKDYYAPLLINKINSYSDIAITNVSGTYISTENKKYAGSSLIGDVGSKNASNISMSFAGIVLQDGLKTNEEPMFSKAMLLNSFQYESSCSAVYNFNYAEDWKENQNIHQVTYGSELGNHGDERESKEFKELESWYYDKQEKGQPHIYINPENNNDTSGGVSFKKYKPYVNIKYNENEKYHEVQVNVYVYDIIEGCGTYGHPYQISSEEELIDVARYINDGKVAPGWKIRASKQGAEKYNETKLHNDNDSECCIYAFDGSQWSSVQNDGSTKTMSKEEMREYLRNAYYKFTADIVLTDKYPGLGTVEESFRGVLTGGTAESPTTVTLSGKSTNALINYSYGSVVINLNVKLSGEKTIKVDTATDGTATACYGAVINQVLGGDNFIDNVSVQKEETFELNITGKMSHLVPAGGYVGLHKSGSVIFRNIKEAPAFSDVTVGENTISSTNENKKYLYINPYIGRVLDAAAFYEVPSDNDSNLSEINNTDKNYKIVTIAQTAAGRITTDYVSGPPIFPSNNAMTVKTTVSNAQQLLIFSAIINSGAASGGTSLQSGSGLSDSFRGAQTYYGQKLNYFGNQDYGKARNASYHYIGSNAEQAEQDYMTSLTDDCETVAYGDKGATTASNLPYLVKQYSDGKGLTYFICAAYARHEFELKAGENGQTQTYNMSIYGSAYRGIGSQYVPCYDAKWGKYLSIDRLTPYEKSSNGNNNTIDLNRVVKEYQDDNYHVAAVGGLYNNYQSYDVDEKDKNKNVAEVKNYTLKGTVKLEYIDENGNPVNEIGYDTFKTVYTVGVGGLCGKSATTGNRKKDCDFVAKISNVQLNNLTVSSYYNSGGIFGLTGLNATINDEKYSFGGNNYINLTFENCGYFGLTATSKYNTGGFVGWSAANVGDTSAGSNNFQNKVENCTISAKSISTISAEGEQTEKTSMNAGAFFGTCDASLKATDSNVSGVNINGGNAGIVAGRVRSNNDDREVAIDTLKVGVSTEENVGDNIDTNNSKTQTKAVKIKASNLAGGFVGVSEAKSSINNSQMSNAEIISGNAGGILGTANRTADIYGCEISNTQFTDNTTPVGALLNAVLKAITTNESGSVAAALIAKLNADLTGGNLIWKNNTYSDSYTNKATWVGTVAENRTVKLAGVSRKNDSTDENSKFNTEPYPDIATSNVKNSYVAYTDYTVENAPSADLSTDSTVSYPEAKFDDNNKLEMQIGEFIYLGDGDWKINNNPDGYATWDETTKILTANKTGTVNLSKGTEEYTVTIVVAREIVLLENGKYSEGNSGPYEVYTNDGKKVKDWKVKRATFSSGGMYSDQLGSTLEMKVNESGTYKITYGAVNREISPGRMRIVKSSNSLSQGAQVTNSQNWGYMSVYDKDAWGGDRHKNFRFFTGNTVEKIELKEGEYLYLNYDYFENGKKNEGKYENGIHTGNIWIDGTNLNKSLVTDSTTKGIKGQEWRGYNINTDEDRELFKTIKVTYTPLEGGGQPKNSKLKVVGTNKKYLYRGESVSDKTFDLNVVLYNEETNAMYKLKEKEYRISDVDTTTAGEKKITVTSVSDPTLSDTFDVTILEKSADDTNQLINVIEKPDGRYANGESFLGDFGILYGDGLCNTTDAKTNVHLILDELNSNTPVQGHVLHTTTGVASLSLNDFAQNKLSSYKLQNPETECIKNFSVLLASGDRTDQDIHDYLNIVTNGGYSKAEQTGSVEASSETYQWDGSGFKDMNKSTMSISKTDTGYTYSVGKDYDNSLNQFTLLTVKFNSGTHVYKVFVPIVVQRIIEVDFMATFTDDSTFLQNNYNTFEGHVLSEFDKPMSGLLTWKYDSSKGTPTRFDWESFMQAGGDLTQPFKKTINFRFSGGYLPAGTRITLIDTQHDDYTYFYTVTDTTDTNGNNTTITLDQFDGFDETPISKLLGITATVDPSNGKFVEVTEGDDGNATIVIAGNDGKDHKYRLWNEETDSKDESLKNKRCDITIPSSPISGFEETYYVVVQVPKAKADGIVSINGAVSTNVSTSAPCEVTQVHRYAPTEIDKGEQSESTFSIYSGYSQELNDSSSDTNPKLVYADGDEIEIDVVNKITFNKNQAYAEKDELYHKFVISPREYSRMDDKEISHAFSRDSDTNGNVEFYVYYIDASGEKQYVNSSGKECDGNTSWASYLWSANEERMSLILGSDNTTDTAIDLSKVRTRCMQNDVKIEEDDTGKRSFYVEAKMKLNISSATIADLVPASSGDVPDRYLRFHYSSTLAKTQGGLDDSSWRGNMTGKHKYYKAETGSPQLTFNGDNSAELGINVRDLANPDPQVIHATALLNLKEWSNYKSILANAKKVNFKMRLQQKQSDGGYGFLSDGQEYISSLMVGRTKDGNTAYEKVTYTEGAWTWSANRTSDNNFEFDNYTDENGFIVPVTFAVKVSADQGSWNYANYRLYLEVEFIDENGAVIQQPVVGEKYQPLSDYVTYTVAKISTEFLSQ